MRILIDYDGTVSVHGKIADWKVDLMKKAVAEGHSVSIYTSRKGEAVENLKNKLYKKFALKIRAIGGRENFDLFIDEKAGGWEKLVEMLRKHVKKEV